MAKVEPIAYLEALSTHYKAPIETFVRVSTILKDHYILMFKMSYSAKIVRTKLCDRWFNRSWVLMEVPEQNLPDVAKFSSVNWYKRAYRLIWE